MSDNGKRRKWSAADKLRIVLAGMQPNVEISDLCRRNQRVRHQGWRDTFVFFQHEDAGKGPQGAKRFLELAA